MARSVRRPRRAMGREATGRATSKRLLGRLLGRLFGPTWCASGFDAEFSERRPKTQTTSKRLPYALRAPPNAQVGCLALEVVWKSPPVYGRANPSEGGLAMMLFTEQIQIAFAEATRSGILPGVANLPERLRDFEADGCELDRLWAELLQHYQRGPRQAWAAVLLEAMRPDLAAAVAAVPAFPPVITPEDFAQQLMTNVLLAALDNPADRARWTPNRLISRASQNTQKWLAREIPGVAKRARYANT